MGVLDTSEVGDRRFDTLLVDLGVVAEVAAQEAELAGRREELADVMDPLFEVRYPVREQYPVQEQPYGGHKLHSS